MFSCFNQDQPLDRVDFPGLAARLAQNSVQEKLTAQWIDRCLVHLQRRPLPLSRLRPTDAENGISNSESQSAC